MSLTIPKIIHQIWIGPKPAPIKLMDTWKNMHPEFEYIYWNENEIINRGLNLIGVKNRIDEMEEICGKVDIIRWMILFEYGGIFIDADSICIEPFDDTILNTKSFAGWENETLRPGLIAIGTMGFPPKHPLVGLIIEWIKANCVSVEKTGLRAWQTVGPTLLTNMYNTGLFKDMTIFPSYYFLPIHCTNFEYNGHGKIYAYQEWGSTRQNYDTMNELTLPSQYIPDAPEQKVSVLVSSYNTKAIYINQCLESIKSSQGNFFIELISF